MSVLSNEALGSVKSYQNIQIFPENDWYLYAKVYPFFILFSWINKHVDKLHQTEFKREIFVFQIRVVCIYLEYSSLVVSDSVVEVQSNYKWYEITIFNVKYLQRARILNRI